jgi:hypothetical protein
MVRSAICVLLVSTAASVGVPAQKAASGAADLPKTTQKALDDLYKKHWDLAPIDPQSTSCAGATGAPSATVQGDFNNDGLPDTAIAVKAADGSGHLVVVFDRKDMPVVATADALPPAGLTGVLSVARLGTTYTNPDDGLKDFFASDTLMLTPCGQPATAYFWNGLGFRKIVLAQKNTQM